MAFYNGWLIVYVPVFPAAPQSIELSYVSVNSVNTNPFSGMQQIYDWSANWTELRVNLPPMNVANFQNWITFFKSCNGVANVFQFESAFQAAYPNDIPGGAYWRLKNNTITWSLGANRIYSVSFECRQAI